MSSTSASAAPKSKGRKATTAAPAAAAPAAPAPAPVVAAPAPAATISHVEAPAASEEVNVVAQFNGLVEKVNGLRSTLSTVFSEMKKLEKQIPRELKRAQKGRRRKAVSADGEDKPKKETVFTKPTWISPDLCKFLGLPAGTAVSRADVTTKVCAYAKTKGLMEKQVIKADAALRKLLALTEKDELKILNLQKYLKPHYANPANAVVATA
jgi:hypothetical protein